MNHKSEVKQSHKTAIFFLITFACLLLLRIPYTAEDIWTIDEAGFAAVANKLVDGGALYKDACDNKPPLTYWFYAAVFSLFGKGNLLAVHLATLPVVLISLYLVFGIAKLLFSQSVAYASAIIYALYLVAAIGGDVFASNTETYLTPAFLAGIYFCLIANNTQRNRYWFAGGLCFGLASWAKQPGILFTVVVPMVLLINAYPLDRKSLSECFRKCIWAFAGFCTLSTLLLALLWKQNSFRDFLDAVVFYNTSVQLSSIPISLSLRMAGYTAYAFFKTYFGAILLSLTGLSSLIAVLIGKRVSIGIDIPTSRLKRSALILLGILAITLVAVSIGRRFYGYYFYAMAPTVAILAALSLNNYWKQWRSFSPILRSGLIIFIGAGILAPLYIFQSGYIWALKRFINYKPYSYSSLISVPISTVSIYVKNNTAESDEIFIWGYQPQIYVLSGRHFATRYFSVALQTGFVWGTMHQISGWAAADPAYAWIYPDWKKYDFKPWHTSQWIYPGSQDILLKELKAHPPELFIDGNVSGEWPFGDKYPIKYFPQFRKFIDDNYQLETVVIGYHIYRHSSPQPVRQATADLMKAQVE
jgi:4-amino-4-deoxy-L-arabinose transferase-like glycosyltransferase